MEKIVFLTLTCITLLASCVPASTAAPTAVPVTTQPSPTEQAPLESTPTPEVSLRELGITDPDVVKAFAGFGSVVTHEADGRYSVTIDKTKYFLDLDTFNLHADLNNAYAPSTVDAVDADENQVTLIWNREGLSVNTPLSTDIENPTDFDNSNKLTTLQRYLLQNADPFSERSKGLQLQTELSETGKVSYLRTDVFGNQSKPSYVWLRYTAPGSHKYIVNPTDINDTESRIVAMCAYGKNATIDEIKRKLLNANLHRENIPNRNFPPALIWPILKADKSFFENLRLDPNISGTDYSDLAYLLELTGNKPEDISFFGDVIDYLDNNYPVSTENPVTSATWTVPINPQIQEIILPCDIK